jgi:formiminotetrahydrofolate cyclodeaminase
VIGLNDGYREILDAIASDSPTPGGGSVAALSLAHAHALVCMVARLTLKSGKWESGHDTATRVLDGSHKGIANAIDLARRDAESFDSVMLAFRMPKTTDEELSQRRSAIAKGYLKASKVPLETAETGVVLLQGIAEFASNCNANAITDLAAAAQLAHSSVSIAALNVKINLDSLDDSFGPDFKDEAFEMSVMIENLVVDAEGHEEEISQIVAGRI